MAVAKVAEPLPSNKPEPKVVPPSRNATVPVGIPVPETGATFEVKATLWPVDRAEGLAASETVVATTLCETVTVTEEEVEGLSFESPL